MVRKIKGDVVVSGWKNTIDDFIEWIAVFDRYMDEDNPSDLEYYASAVYYKTDSSGVYRNKLEIGDDLECDTQQWTRNATQEEIDLINHQINLKNGK